MFVISTLRPLSSLVSEALVEWLDSLPLPRKELQNRVIRFDLLQLHRHKTTVTWRDYTLYNLTSTHPIKGTQVC